jgi:GxxExxY protein
MIDLNSISYDIIGCAYKVHAALGPGLLESTYEVCLAHKLNELGYKVETQKPLPVVFEGIKLDAGYRIDLLVNDLVIVELKSIECILPIHKAQLLTYMKLSNISLGLLINFNVTDLKQGITRMVL